jgi:hypothetical protein
MASTILRLSIVPKRMLKKHESADHCGRSVKRFEAECPVKAIRFPNGDLRWDIGDLDAWLDAIKYGDATNAGIDEILEKLE